MNGETPNAHLLTQCGTNYMTQNLELPMLVENSNDKADCVRIDLYAEHAKEKAGLPSNWRIYQWSCFPKDGSECIYIAVTGAVCEHKKSNGETNWKLRDKTTVKTVNLPVVEHEKWKLEWENKAGKCSRCTGTGEVMESWNHITGIKMRACPKCNGDGATNCK